MKRLISWLLFLVALLIGIALGAVGTDWVMDRAQGQTIDIPASTHPTESAPNFILDISITDAMTGQPVRADVFLGQSPDIDVAAPADALQLMCHDVSACEVVMTGTAVSQATNVQIIAPGYVPFSIIIRPHVVRSRRMVMPIKLTPVGKKV